MSNHILRSTNFVSDEPSWTKTDSEGFELQASITLKFELQSLAIIQYIQAKGNTPQKELLTRYHTTYF